MTLNEEKCIYPDPYFKRKKAQILHDLSIPEITDRSPKGSVDTRILPIMETINAHNDYVTTSSCSGRIAVYCDPIHTSVLENVPTDSYENTTIDGESSQATTKGGGHWMFVTHDPVTTQTLTTENVTDLLFPGVSISESHVLVTGDCQLIWFRFEPMILHVQSRDVLRGREFMELSFCEGFRNTGLGISTKKRTIVSVRDASKVDVPVAFMTSDNNAQLLVSRPYLLFLLKLANRKFKHNFDHMERYNQALKLRLPTSDEPKLTSAETKELRREAKRAAGLERQKQIKDQLKENIDTLTVSDISLNS